MVILNVMLTLIFQVTVSAGHPGPRLAALPSHPLHDHADALLQGVEDVLTRVRVAEGAPQVADRVTRDPQLLIVQPRRPLLGSLRLLAALLLPPVLLLLADLLQSPGQLLLLGLEPLLGQRDPEQCLLQVRDVGLLLRQPSLQTMFASLQINTFLKYFK